jgi:hypothetical protein
MRIISTLFDDIGTMPFGRLSRRTVQAPAETPPNNAPMSRRDELKLLEKKALEKGMSNDELSGIQRIGECSEQVQTRITQLHQWLAAH